MQAIIDIMKTQCLTLLQLIDFHISFHHSQFERVAYNVYILHYFIFCNTRRLPDVLAHPWKKRKNSANPSCGDFFSFTCLPNCGPRAFERSICERTDAQTRPSKCLVITVRAFIAHAAYGNIPRVWMILSCRAKYVRLCINPKPRGMREQPNTTR